MRVVSLLSPLKGHQPQYVFNFLYFWSWIFDKSSKFWAASSKNKSTLVRFNPAFYWLAHFHLMKKFAKVQLYFGLGCRMVEFFTCKPQPKEQLMSLLHLWSLVWRKRSRLEHMQTVNRTSRRIRCLFAWSGSELWSSFKYSRSKIKNEKHIAVDVFLKGFSMTTLMQIQSGRTVPLTHYKKFPSSEGIGPFISLVSRYETVVIFNVK